MGVVNIVDNVWVDGRSGSQAKTKTKTKQAMQLKLAGHDVWHIVGHFDMKKNIEQKNPEKFLSVTRL